MQSTPELLRRLLDAKVDSSLGKPRVDRTAEELAEFKNLYLDTTLGRIDILGALPPVGSFEHVASRAIAVVVHGHACRIVGLDDLIAVKAHVARPKDKQVELELRAIRERLGR